MSAGFLKITAKLNFRWSAASIKLLFPKLEQSFEGKIMVTCAKNAAQLSTTAYSTYPPILLFSWSTLASFTPRPQFLSTARPFNFFRFKSLETFVYTFSVRYRERANGKLNLLSQRGNYPAMQRGAFSLVSRQHSPEFLLASVSRIHRQHCHRSAAARKLVRLTITASRDSRDGPSVVESTNEN